MNLLLVFIGGGLGSLARYGVGIFSKRIFNSDFPYGTILSNISASLILGFLAGFLALRSSGQEPYRLLVAVGFCGGFSTFSAFTLETFEMLRTGNYLLASANILLSLAVCLGALYAGSQLARFF